MKNINIRNLFNKILSKIKKWTIFDWSNFILWLLTFFMLIVLIICATLKANFDQVLYANLIASLVLTFSILLITSIFNIVIHKYIEKKKGVINGNSNSK